MDKLQAEYIFQPHKNGVDTAAYSEDSQFLATSGYIGNERGIKVWRTLDWRLVGEYICSPDESIAGLLFCEDGSILFGEGNGDESVEECVVRISPETWKSDVVISGLTAVWELTEGHNKNQLVIRTPSIDPDILWEGSSALFYNMNTWEMEKVVDLNAKFASIACSPVKNETVKVTSARLKAPNDKFVRVVDTIDFYLDDFSQWLTSFSIDDVIHAIRYSPSGKYLAAVLSESVCIWDASSREPVAYYTTITPEDEEYLNSSRALSFSPDGMRIVAGGFDSLFILKAPFRL